MAVELKVPEVGESITEVEIGEWLKSEGERVEKDENIVVIETEKVTLELPAPVSGTVTKVLKRRGEPASVGETIGYMEAGEIAGKMAQSETEKKTESAKPEARDKEKSTEKTDKETRTEERKGAEEARLKAEAKPRVMPAATRVLSEHGTLHGSRRTARALAEPFGSWPRCGHSQTPDGAMSRVRSTVSMPAGRHHWAPMSGRGPM